MWLWIKQWCIVPLSYAAAFCSILVIAVEILGMTTWGLVMKARRAANEYRKLVAPERAVGRFQSQQILITVAVAATVVFLMSRKGKK